MNLKNSAIDGYDRRLIGARAWILVVIALVAIGDRSEIRAQTVVDEIVAVVNNDIITRSDLLWAIALNQGAPSPAEAINGDLLRQALEVSIDRTLIRQEAERLPSLPIAPEELSRKRAEIVSQFPSESAFRQRIQAVGLTPERLDDLIRERIQIERFVDFRFRLFVFVSESDVQRYYDEELVPEITGAGLVPPALDEVREQITARLREEKLNEEIDRYLTSARQRAEIVTLVEL